MAASNSQIPFAPLGQTVVVAAAAVAPAGVQAPIFASSGTSAGQFRIFNSSTNLVHIGVGATAAAAQSNAVAAAAGAPATSIPLPPGACEILRFGQDNFFSGVSSAAASVFITPGEGL